VDMVRGSVRGSRSAGLYSGSDVFSLAHFEPHGFEAPRFCAPFLAGFDGQVGRHPSG